VLATSLDALTGKAQPLDLLTRGLTGRQGGVGRFESITGTFQIAEGIARTDDLRIVEREHRIDLNGTLRLADLALDMRGSLSFADDARGGRRGIPLAHVRGTIGDPEVEVTREAARSFAAALEPSRLGAKLRAAVGPDAARPRGRDRQPAARRARPPITGPGPSVQPA
jgi:hypothetical protein